MEKVYQLKIQLRRPNPQAGDEFFRTTLKAVEGQQAFKLAALKDLLHDVIPVTVNRNYRLLWKDSDGDEITLNSDEALHMALNEMEGPVYRFIIALMKLGQGPAAPREQGEPHPGVCCDNCEKDIVGFRYKCVVCPDYDLCSRCEAKGLHSEHNMIRMASPNGAYPKHFFRRITKLHEKMSAKKDKAAQKEHQEQHQSAHEKALEAAGIKPGTAQTVTTSTVETSSVKKTDGKQDDDSSDEDPEPEEPSLEEVIAQLSTHGADYLRNLGSMISTTLDNIMVEEEEDENEEGKKELSSEEKAAAVDKALETMKEMGYTNENDWLKQLLTTVNGDVDKALAVLAKREGRAVPVTDQLEGNHQKED